MSRNKIAFLVHDPIMLAHYADVWRALGSANFTIVLTSFFYFDLNGNEKLGLSDFFDHVTKQSYCVEKLADVINCGKQFKYVVTNHMISGSTKHVKSDSPRLALKKFLNRCMFLLGKNMLWNFAVDENTYLPLQIGKKQIRFMYGADISDGWSLQSWNEIYDIFLCHGANDAQEINKRFKGDVFVMGYPRYDRYFSEKVDVRPTKLEFKIAASKKTILWMPTLGGDYSSIPLFAEPLSCLTKKYNIIVRPHPISFVQEKHYIGMLKELNFNIDGNALRDMNELYSVADVILADNGGTPFSAIFLRKNIVFLEVPDDLGPESTATSYIAGSSVMELKKYLPVVNHQEIYRLENMLNSMEFCEDNLKQVDLLFKRYFDSPRGGGAQRVADILSGLPY